MNTPKSKNDDDGLIFYGYDHVTFWVSNAKQAAEWYCINFGFEQVGYRGLETIPRDEEIVSHVIQQGDIIFVLQSSLKPINPTFGLFMQTHGDGIKDIAFTVNDCNKIYDLSIKKGAKSILEPYVVSDEDVIVTMATVLAFGDITHTFVQRKFKNEEEKHLGFSIPSYQKINKTNAFKDFTPTINLQYIDHIVGNQNVNDMNNVSQWYIDVLGFKRYWSIDDKLVKTENSSLKSVVLSDSHDNLKFLLAEPSKGNKKGQIQEFLDFYGGPGIQHIAFHTNDMIKTVEYLSKRGVEFLKVPKEYYVQICLKLSSSQIKISESLDSLEKNNVLIDFDDKGYLLQIFTKPVQDRPTLFYEIIQRHSHLGFGAGNILALYKSFEHEQMLRGNLTEN